MCFISTAWDYARRKFWVGYWKALVARRHPSKLVRDSHTPPSLKLQLGLAALGMVLLAGGIASRNRQGVIGGGLAWGLLVLSAISFLKKVLERDAAVLTVAPGLLVLRASALGWGFLVGNLRFLIGGRPWPGLTSKLFAIPWVIF